MNSNNNDNSKWISMSYLIIRINVTTQQAVEACHVQKYYYSLNKRLESLIDSLIYGNTMKLHDNTYVFSMKLARGISILFDGNYVSLRYQLFSCFSAHAQSSH